ncbi:LysE family translocator [Zymobacter sp. IVIA_12111.31 C1]|uniref:LysE family translocator n=1 Tax=Zymobacter sp. IVIA_12111.31 C1 TaxID=3394854 RepID=UPI0039C0263A
MTLHTWWMFIGAVFLLSAIPGPNMLLILSRSIEAGFTRSIAAMMGSLSAVIIVLLAAMAGLTTLFMAIPGAFETLRYVGVAYLFYLGLKAWRTAPAATDGEDPLHAAKAVQSLPRLFRSGFVTSISNPKLILFTAAFFPQFIAPEQPQLPQFAILITTFAVIETFWYFMYALGGRTLASYLRRPTIKTLFNRATGIIFWGFGVMLLRVSAK